MGIPARHGVGVRITKTRNDTKTRNLPPWYVPRVYFSCFPTVRSVSWFRVFVVSCFVAVAAPAFAQQTYVLVVTGVPGDEEHAKKFDGWAKTFVDAAKKKDSVPAANITLLAGPQAAKAHVEKAFADIAARVKPNDSRSE